MEATDSRRDERDATEKVDNAGGDEDACHKLYLVLNSIRANLDQLVENCSRVHDRINLSELDCIDLLQPMGDIISLERELKHLMEVESSYSVKTNNENN